MEGDVKVTTRSFPNANINRIINNTKEELVYFRFLTTVSLLRLGIYWNEFLHMFFGESIPNVPFSSARCRTGNGKKLSSTQAEPGQAINSAVTYFPSISCATSCARERYSVTAYFFQLLLL